MFQELIPMAVGWLCPYVVMLESTFSGVFHGDETILTAAQLRHDIFLISTEFIQRI